MKINKEKLSVLFFAIICISTMVVEGQETGLVKNLNELQAGDLVLVKQTASNFYIGSQDITTNHSSTGLMPYTIYNEDIQMVVRYINPGNLECQFYVKSTEQQANPYYLHAITSNSWTTQIGEYTYGGLTTWYLYPDTTGTTQIRNSQTTGRYLGSDAITVKSALYRDKGKNADELTRTYWKFYRVSELQTEKSTELEAATEGSPIELTGVTIINPSFEIGDPTGWRNDGFQGQNNNEFPGTKDGSYYCEKWVTIGTNLTSAIIYQKLTGLLNGKYEVTLSGGIKMQSSTGGEDLPAEGLSVFANYTSTPMDSIIDDYSVITSVTNNELTLGVELKDATGNYAYFDNVKLFYYGDSFESYLSTLDPMIDKANALLNEGGFAISLNDTLAAAIDTAELAKESASLEEVMKAIEDLGYVMKLIDESVLDYVKLKNYIYEIQSAINVYNRTDLSDYYQGLLTAYNNRAWDAIRIDEEIAKKDSLFFTEELEPVDKDLYKIKQRFDIDMVEASFPVGFSQAIAGNNHYITYYDKDKNFCIGYRKFDETSFKKTILNSKIEWDSHNYTEMIVDNEGYIHLSGNMHNVQLKYWRSKNPYDASEFEEIHYMTGQYEDNTTYPKFINTNSGDLLFHYRYGVSGNGFEVYNIWDPETKTWNRFLDQPLIDGQGLRNAYMKGPFYEADGYYHLYWVWRETADCATNHTFSYARSLDLKHWENAAGEAVSSPMVFSENKLAVDPSSVKYGTGMLNGVQGHTLDSQNRIVLCNMKYDSLGNSQLYVYRLKEDKTWEEICITNWIYRFNFSGYGSIIFEIQLKGMRNLGNGELGVSYYHLKYGTGDIILDEETLRSIDKRVYAPTYPIELDSVTTTGTYSKPINVRINQVGNYIMRWETMDQSNDQKPSGTLPDYYMMELIELESDSVDSVSTVYHNTNEGDLRVIQIHSSLEISGLTEGNNVMVIDARGVILQRFVAKKQEYYLPVPGYGFYIICTGKESCKIVIQ